MKYLLDTHTVLWIAESSSRLSARVRALARSQESDAFGLAAISLFEIARKARDGEILLVPDPAEWLEDLGTASTCGPSRRRSPGGPSLWTGPTKTRPTA